MTINPLQGVRVLDLTVLPPGGYCTLQLADLGADVVRIERPSMAGQPSLVIGQVGLSRGKRSMTLDTRHEKANSVLERLAGASDVLVENAKPGSMAARGFGYPQASESCPSLIWCSISGFGQDGPYAHRAGHDLSYLGHSGLLSAIATELPWHPAAMLSVPLGALMAATAVLAAIVERGKTGKGCQIDISLADVSTWMLSGDSGALTGTSNGIPVSPDRRLYQCADDRFISVAAAEPRTWTALCNTLELPDLLDQLRVSGDQAVAVTERLAAVFATKPAAEWVALLGPVGAAVNAVNAGRDIIDDPHNRARGTTVKVAGEDVPANPIRLTDADGGQTSTATSEPPTVGQHTDAVLGEAGFSADEIAKLRAENVV